MKTLIQPGASIDAVSPAELTQFGKELEARYNMMVREQLRGEKLMRLPNVYATATGASTLLGEAGDVTPGPESGYVWRICRLTVASNGADNAKFGTPGSQVFLYISSDGTATQRNLVDSTLQVGAAYYPSSRGLYLMPGESLLAVVTSVASNVYTLTGQVASVPAERMGKLI